MTNNNLLGLFQSSVDKIRVLVNVVTDTLKEDQNGLLLF